MPPKLCVAIKTVESTLVTGMVEVEILAFISEARLRATAVGRGGRAGEGAGRTRLRFVVGTGDRRSLGWLDGPGDSVPPERLRGGNCGAWGEKLAVVAFREGRLGADRENRSGRVGGLSTLVDCRDFFFRIMSTVAKCNSKSALPSLYM